MDSYIENINRQRKEEDARAAADPLDWINLVGLFWLEEGKNSLGSDEDAKIFLPQLPKPDCGYFLFEDGKVTIHPNKDIAITMNGGAIENRPLRTDAEDESDSLEIGSLTFKIIIRGADTLVRVWDRNSENRRKFKGFKYYPVNPEYRITAKYVRYSPPKSNIKIDAIGTESDGRFLGQAQFTLNGVPCTLEAEESGRKLLFNFRDETNNDTTYGGGRKFYLPVPEGDEIILDFNLAEHWPCAYTPYATCPIPPRENKLAVRVEAGEKKFKD